MSIARSSRPFLIAYWFQYNCSWTVIHYRTRVLLHACLDGHADARRYAPRCGLQQHSLLVGGCGTRGDVRPGLAHDELLDDAGRNPTDAMSLAAVVAKDELVENRGWRSRSSIDPL
jgi:hypothetical protein